MLIKVLSLSVTSKYLSAELKYIFRCSLDHNSNIFTPFIWSSTVAYLFLIGPNGILHSCSPSLCLLANKSYTAKSFYCKNLSIPTSVPLPYGSYNALSLISTLASQFRMIQSSIISTTLLLCRCLLMFSHLCCN